MGLSVGNKILASDFIALKARVKAECNRRKYKGSIKAYAGTDYDYTVEPAVGGDILPEHVNKLIVPMSQINDVGIEEVAAGDVVRTISAIEEFVTASESYTIRGTSTNCKSSCTGLCLGGCGGGCTGCGGSCTGNCTGGCTGCTGCSGGCKGCTSTCQTTCSLQCALDCRGGCQGGCFSNCKGGCRDTCKGQCTGTCNTTAS